MPTTAPLAEASPPALREPHTRLFVRDDDVGPLTPRLRSFIDAFAGALIPVSYQVIPTALTEDCAWFLKQKRAAAPHLFEFGQHGFRHEMTVRGRRVFYEYGPELDYEAQLATILEGQALLHDLLGDDFSSMIFTPPRHRYDRTTLIALAAAGVRILSASSYCGLPYRLAYAVGRLLGLSNLGRPGVSYHGQARPDSGLFELSVAVPVDNGSRTQVSVAEVLGQISHARRHTSVVGLMFHHNAYASELDQAFLYELAAALRTLPNVSFHHLVDLHEQMSGDTVA